MDYPARRFFVRDPRLDSIPQIDTVIVNLMNTDEPGARFGNTQWDAQLVDVLAARLRAK